VGSKRLLGSSNNRSISALCHFYHIIAFIPGYAILSPMVNRICMFCFFMDSIFPMYEFLDTCSNPWSAIFLYRYKSVRNSNKCNNLIKMAKNHYFSTISEKIKAESSGSKNWWNLVKRHNFGSLPKLCPAFQNTDQDGRT
jgi:hypothetical protein